MSGVQDFKSLETNSWRNGLLREGDPTSPITPTEGKDPRPTSIRKQACWDRLGLGFP